MTLIWKLLQYKPVRLRLNVNQITGGVYLVTEEEMYMVEEDNEDNFLIEE